MTLVRETDAIHCSRWGIGIDKYVGVTLDEAIPFEVQGNGRRCGSDVTEHGLLPVGLAAHELIVGVDGGLDGGNDMGFKLREAVLDTDGVLATVVLLKNLLVQAVINATVEYVRVIGGRHLASTGVETSGMLTEGIDRLGTLSSA